MSRENGSAPKIALVLGGGGIAGYSFHAGALGALEEVTGWDPRTAEIIVGTSAGSSIAAVLRGNVPVIELVDRILSVPTDPVGMDRLRRVAGRGQDVFGGLWFGPSSPTMIGRELLRGHRARPLRLLAGTLPSGRLATGVLGEQIGVLHPCGWPDGSLWVTAVDLSTGHVAVFGRDPIPVDPAVAVEASCAIPAFYRPVALNGRRYIDGGVRSPTNADLLLDQDLDLAVILSPMSVDQLRFRSPLAVAIRSYPRRQLRCEVEALHEAGIPTLVVEPDQAVVRAMGPNPMDPTRVVSVMIASIRSSLASLDAPDAARSLDLLRQAAATFESPTDVPYPE